MKMFIIGSDFMLLNDRKVKILEAIIKDYIETAEPIGSRTIAKKYDLGISSATIRNEMSDLEDMGLIIQPHASAGRVPSDKGYRLYVDKLMQCRELSNGEVNFLHSLVINNINQIDYLMQETAKLLSALTSYTTIITSPQVSRIKIKQLSIIPLDETAIVLVVITDENAVKNHIIKIQKPPSIEVLAMLNIHLNSTLSGITFEEISEAKFNELVGRFGEYSYVLPPVLTAISEILRTQDGMKVYTSGAKNILAYPEFSNIEKARAIFQTLEENEVLITLLQQQGNEAIQPEAIQILIGTENDVDQIRDCSLIKANYFLGDKTPGSIGILGPTRMDYAQVVSILGGIVKNINTVIGKLSGG